MTGDKEHQRKWWLELLKWAEENQSWGLYTAVKEGGPDRTTDFEGMVAKYRGWMKDL